MPTKIPARHLDPTRTLTLRRKAVGQVNRRFTAIQKVITESLVTNQVLANAEAATRRRFEYLAHADKQEEFMAWLNEQVQAEIFETQQRRVMLQDEPPVNRHREFWLVAFIGAGYDSGVKAARHKFSKVFLDAGLDASSVYANPAHIERAEVLFSRVYRQLDGVTGAMEGQMATILSDGMIQGKNPYTVAKSLNERVDKIGKVRARLIARTEIVNAHQQASIVEGEELSRMLGEEVKYQWHTALDGRERPSHRARHRKIYTKEQVAALVGEPNCRCSVSPWVKGFGR